MESDPRKEKLAALQESRDRYVDRLTWFALSLIAIFGAPAALAIVVGKVILDNQIALIVSLLLAFILSWVIVLMYYQRVSRKVRLIEREIQDLRIELGLPDPKQEDDDKDE